MGISLEKGQKISLVKEGEPGLTKVAVGLGWDPVKKKGWFSSTPEIDLDASCILVNDKGEIVDAVFYNHLTSNDGSIVHQGDNRTGQGDGKNFFYQYLENLKLFLFCF